jgi:hypothetical protein
MTLAHTPYEDTILPHQDLIETVVDERISANQTEDVATFVSKGTTTVASPTAPGATYSQAEAASMKTAIDNIRAVLTARGITA